jgi:SAM-dependent methyltransferase
MADPAVRAAETYDRMAEAYEAAVAEGERPYNSLYERPAIVSMLPDVAGMRVLDVGCGSGPLSAWFSSHGAAEVLGFDVSERMVRIAQQKQIQRASFRVADLSKPLDFLAEESFDLAVASLVMHYLHDWVQPLRELRRVLRADGRLIFSTHHPAQDVELSKSGNYFETELVHDRWDLDGEAFDVHFWRRPLSDMFAAFEQVGFTVISFLEPQPLPECREKFPRAWQSLTTRPAFAFFKLAPAGRHQPASDAV